MDTSKIGVRYARALFGVAQDKSLVDKVRQDFDLIILTLKDSPDLPLALNNPVVKPSRKSQILTTIFSGQIQELTLNFLKMVVEKRRESYLQDIARHFFYLYRTSKGLKPAHLSVASEITEATRNEIRALIKGYFKTEVELTEDVKKSIIGGFILTVDDLQLDASISSGLQKIKRELSQKLR
jgi:F-type H+-transporting ATPase subunit delta